MATLDLNNSYWAQKLLRFKDGTRLFPAGSGGAGDGIENLVLQTFEPSHVHPHESVYISALALLVATYSAKEEILIAAPASGEFEPHAPLFYALEIRRDWPVTSFVAAVKAEMETSRAHGEFQFKSVAALLELSEELI